MAARATPKPVSSYLYRWIQRLVPIACVDVFPLDRSTGEIRLGLIQRVVHDGSLGWALVGGGILRGETVEEAAGRHIADTLGPGVTWARRDFAVPDALGEYFPDDRPGHGFDPRKHAVAISYFVELSGVPDPQGEARDFRWFSAAEVPERDAIGFRQWVVIERLRAQLAGDGRPD